MGYSMCFMPIRYTYKRIRLFENPLIKNRPQLYRASLVVWTSCGQVYMYTVGIVASSRPGTVHYRHYWALGDPADSHHIALLIIHSGL